MADDLHEWTPRALTAEQVDEIRRSWPLIEPSYVDGAIDGCRRDLNIKPEPASSTRKKLQSLRRRSGNLQRLLEPLIRHHDSDLFSAMYRVERFSEVRSGAAAQTIAALDRLQVVLEAAAKRLPKGKANKGEEQALVEDLSTIIEKAGYSVGMSSSSPLVELMQMSLEALHKQRRGRLGRAEAVVERWLKEKSRSKKAGHSRELTPENL